MRRDRENAMLGGVCAGIAEECGVDPLFIRLLFVFLAATSFGVFIYLILWLLME
jgi:phage shock protein C